MLRKKIFWNGVKISFFPITLCNGCSLLKRKTDGGAFSRPEHNAESTNEEYCLIKAYI